MRSSNSRGQLCSRLHLVLILTLVVIPASTKMAVAQWYTQGPDGTIQRMTPEQVEESNRRMQEEIDARKAAEEERRRIWQEQLQERREQELQKKKEQLEETERQKKAKESSGAPEDSVSEQGQTGSYLDQAVADLKAADPSTRRKAVLTLRRLGEPKVVVPLVAALGDPDKQVREFAAEALGNLRSAAKEAIPALQTALGDPDPDVAREAGLAIGHIDRTAKGAAFPKDASPASSSTAQATDTVVNKGAEAGEAKKVAEDVEGVEDCIRNVRNVPAGAFGIRAEARNAEEKRVVDDFMDETGNNNDTAGEWLAGCYELARADRVTLWDAHNISMAAAAPDKQRAKSHYNRLSAAARAFLASQR